MSVNESSPPLPASLQPPCWRWINWLALDAVAVALAWLAVFGGMTGTRLTAVHFVVLAAAVWLVYLLDRLTDSWSQAALAGRHRFARKSAPWLMPVMVVVAGGAAWIACYGMPGLSIREGVWSQTSWPGLRLITFKAGALLSLAIGLYFLIVLGSRWKPLSQALLHMVGFLIVLALIPEVASGLAGIHLWSITVIGAILWVNFSGLRHHYATPPWILLKKGLGGYLFAVGVAAAPFSHLQAWEDLLKGAPVLLFAGLCSLNSLGIRLWESLDAVDPELRLLRRIYPWLLAVLGIAALLQAWHADPWTRPVLLGIAVSAAGLGMLHTGHKRWPVMVSSLLADGILFLAGLAVWQMGVAAHPHAN